VDDVLLATTDYELDYETGMLWRLNHGHWHGDIVVVYEGGYDLPTDAEPSLARACIELIRSQRTAIGSNVNVRDIWAGENRISYFGPQQMNGALPTSIANLLEPFKRRGA
ncbi:MAG TPA: hypothetical protein VFK30_03100, partial [Anaerolineae bacterium]|nr:hypothetical protein [Anaerolineae bacterium]